MTLDSQQEYDATIQFLGNPTIGDVYRHGQEFILSKGEACRVSLSLAKSLVADFPGSFVILRVVVATKTESTSEDLGLSRMKEPEYFVVRPVPETYKVPVVSVVMPVYNHEKYLRHAIESILAQSFGHFELIVVDDCSTDDSLKISKSYMDKRIVVVKRLKNGGTGAALNDGFKKARGKYLTWFSSDNWAEFDYLETLVEALDNNQSCGFVYADSYGVGEDGNITPFSFNKDFDRDLLYKMCYVGIAFMFRKQLKDRAGEYSRYTCEDYDMHLRMSELTDFMHVRRFLATWRDHADTVTSRISKPTNWAHAKRIQALAVKRRFALNSKISVVMPTYGQGKYIRSAIESILAQTYKNFELIIINDGSKDDTEKVVRSIQDPRIIYKKISNGGTGRALNEGFKLATGGYETWFASDNLLYDKAFERMVGYMEKNRSCDYVYTNCDIGIMDDSGLVELERKNIKTEVDQRWSRGTLQMHYTLGIVWLWRKYLRAMAGGTFQVEPCEDYDMVLRMADCGGSFSFLDENLGWFRRHNENMTKKLLSSHEPNFYSKFVQQKSRERMGLKI